MTARARPRGVPVEVGGQRYVVDAEVAAVIEALASCDDAAFFAATLADAGRVRPRGEVIDGVDVPAAVPAVVGPRVALRSDTPVPLLDQRRSHRRTGPVPLAAVASTLLAANRILDVHPAVDTYQRTWRPNPSAGGRHPIDLLVDARDITGLAPGAWWFDAFRGQLAHATIDLSDATRHVTSAAGLPAAPAATIYLIAHFDRTGSRYEHAATLVWRDAGALAATLQFAATAHGIGSCIIGTAALVRSGLVLGGVDVGAVVLGPLESPVDA